MRRVKEILIYIYSSLIVFFAATPVFATGTGTITSYKHFLSKWNSSDMDEARQSFNALTKVASRGLLVYSGILVIVGLIALVICAARMATIRDPKTRFLTMQQLASQLILFGMIGALPLVAGIILSLL